MRLTQPAKGLSRACSEPGCAWVQAAAQVGPDQRAKSVERAAANLMRAVVRYANTSKNAYTLQLAAALGVVYKVFAPVRSQL